MGSVRLTNGYECDTPMAQRKGLIGSKKTNLPRCRKRGNKTHWLCFMKEE